MADTDVERSQRAELQRTRRLAKRSCGNCGQPAEAMLPWGGLQVAICATCQARLNRPEPRTPWCAFNEIYPMDLRDQVPTAGVRIEARLMPAVELPPQRRSLAGRFIGALGRMLRPGSGRRSRRAITGKSGSEKTEGTDPAVPDRSTIQDRRRK